ncbi:MAG: hypothetical protein QOG34_1819 [Frankiaceae bacterium]|jgi:hypothetical protein|nr:hypothetical protein [Frankiaceae bacterium]
MADSALVGAHSPDSWPSASSGGLSHRRVWVSAVAGLFDITGQIGCKTSRPFGASNTWRPIDGLARDGNLLRAEARQVWQRLMRESTAVVEKRSR